MQPQKSSLRDLPLLWPATGRGGARQEAAPDPYSFLRFVPDPDSRLGRTEPAGLVGRPLVSLNPTSEPDEGSLHMIAAATRYLYRCRRGGDERPTGDLLRDVLSEADAGKLEAAVAGFFAEERLS